MRTTNSVIGTYRKLHHSKLFAHWLWTAVERVAAGEAEADVMADYGYYPGTKITQEQINELYAGD